MIHKNRKSFSRATRMIILAVLLSGMLLSTIAFAANGTAGQDVAVLEPGVTLNGAGFFAGNIVKVDGTVDGTAFATGQDVTVNGTINGDLFVAAQTITVNGTVTGNIYCAGQYLVLKSKNTGDTFLAGQTITVMNDAACGRDLFLAASKVIFDGSVGRDFRGGGSDIALNGSVGRDAALDTDSLYVGNTAVIGGNLRYQSENEANINSGAKISGQTDWQRVTRKDAKEWNAPRMDVISKLLGIASALFVWFIIKLFKPEIWGNTSEKITSDPLKTIGLGLLALIVAPILVILLMITVIGIPVGILLGVAYAVSLYLSKIIVAVAIGSWFAKRFGWSELHKGVWLTLLGLLVLTILGMIPVVKVLIGLVVVSAGLGAVVSANYRKKAAAEKQN